MIKQFQIIKVAQITTDETIEYFTLEGIFIGGYNNKAGKLIVNDTETTTSDEVQPKTGGVVRPLTAQAFKKQQEHDINKELSSLDTRLEKAKGEQ